MTIEKKRLLAAVIASNFALIAAMIYSLGSSRVSLIFLDKEGFGLVSLISQIVVYLSVLDLGMSTAMTRILIDYAGRDEKNYLQALKTSRLIYLVLGLLGLLGSIVIALFGAKLFEIPDHLRDPFRNILLVQGVVIFFVFLIKPWTSPIIANGRQDLTGWIAGSSMLGNFVVMMSSFYLGMGIYSVMYGIISLCLFTGLSTWFIARRYIPAGIKDATFHPGIFRELVHFSRDTALWQIGGSCMQVMPTFLISIVYGMILVADLSGGMKMALLLVTFCTRLPDLAVAPLAIQTASGERDKAARNLMKVSELTGASGILGAILIATLNPSFIDWWMLGEINWPISANVAVALWLAAVVMGRCFYGYALVGKHLELIRWAPIWKCCLLGLFFSTLHGMLGAFTVIYAMPIAEILVTYIVAVRMHRRTALDATAALPGIYRQTPVALFSITLGSLITIFLANLGWDAFHTFFLAGVLAGSISLAAIPFLLTPETRREVMSTLRLKFTKPKVA